MKETEEEDGCRRTFSCSTLCSQSLFQSRSKRYFVKPAALHFSNLRLTSLFFSESPDLADLASPEAFTHRNSSMARALPPPAHKFDRPWLSFEPSFCLWWLETLGPSVPALSPVKTMTAHGKTLIELVVSLNRPQKQIPSPFPCLMSSTSINYGPSVTPWPRFGFKTLWPIPNFLLARYSDVKSRRHFYISVSTSLIWLSNSASGTLDLLLLISLPWPMSEGNYAMECSLFVSTSISLGLNYFCRIDYLQCNIPDHTSTSCKEIQYSIALIYQIWIQLLRLIYLMKGPNHQPYGLLRYSPGFESLPTPSSLRYKKPLKQHSLSMEKPLPSSSFMERTLLWNFHPWHSTFKVKSRHHFLVFACSVPVTPEAKDTFLTSQNLMIVTKLYFADLFAKASSTHHDLACGTLLCRFCLREPMDLSLMFEGCPLLFSIELLLYFVVSNLEVEELVIVTPFWV